MPESADVVRPIRINAVSGASAGAVNAVVLAFGLANGSRQEEQHRLEQFWRQASEAAPRCKIGAVAMAATRVVSRYQFNPFNLNPFRSILAELIDFDALRQKPTVRLLVATTRVPDGQLRIFREKAVTVDVILASTCLPLLHHAVSIDGEAYWDGGFSANPPLLPLVSATRASEALVVQIMPSVGAEMPITSREIVKRLEQITFNSSLARDMEALTAMRKLSGLEESGSALSRKLQGFRINHIAAEAEFPALNQSSGLNLDWEFLMDLRDAGRRAADQWLESSPSRREEFGLGTRAARLDEFITDAVREAGTLVELLCEDHVGTYLLPFLCRSTTQGFRKEQTDEFITGSVVGWREPKVVSPGCPPAFSRLV